MQIYSSSRNHYDYSTLCSRIRSNYHAHTAHLFAVPERLERASTRAMACRRTTMMRVRRQIMHLVCVAASAHVRASYTLVCVGSLLHNNLLLV